jgi:hypothetical protein
MEYSQIFFNIGKEKQITQLWQKEKIKGRKTRKNPLKP